MTDIRAGAETLMTQPAGAGVCYVAEYEIDIRVHAFGNEPGQQLSLLVAPGRSVADALRIFHAVCAARVRADRGVARLIAWTGTDHDRAFGPVVAEHEWGARDDD